MIQDKKKIELIKQTVQLPEFHDGNSIDLSPTNQILCQVIRIEWVEPFYNLTLTPSNKGDINQITIQYTTQPSLSIRQRVYLKVN